VVDRLAALALLALLALGVVASGHSRRAPVWVAPAALGLASAALLGLGLSGHASTEYGQPRPLGAVADVVHAISLALFAGGLVAALFGGGVRPADGDRPDERRPSAVARFARLALPLGLVAFVSGAIASAVALPALRHLWNGAYGWILLVAGLLLLAATAFSARAALGYAHRAEGSPRGVPVALKLAAPLALGALLGSSTLPLLAAPGVETTPTLPRLDLAAAVPLGPDRSGQIHLSLAPAVPGENGVVFELETAGGPVLPPAEAPLVELVLRPLDHAGDERTVALTPDRFGGWATGSVDLPGAGWWQADVTLVPPAGQGIRVPFWFVLPDPNATGRGPTPSADPAAGPSSTGRWPPSPGSAPSATRSA
jgi:putative copper export protein